MKERIWEYSDIYIQLSFKSGVDNIWYWFQGSQAKIFEWQDLLFKKILRKYNFENMINVKTMLFVLKKRKTFFTNSLCFFH